MTDKMKELLPCPFCGDKHPRLSKYRNSDPVGTLIGYVCRVECESCGANTCLGIERTEEQAVSTWNCRAPLPAVEAAEIEVVDVIGYFNPDNLARVKADEISGFMLHDEESERINTAAMTVAQHRRILAGVNQQAGSGWRSHSANYAKGEKPPQSIETLQAAWDRDQEVIADQRAELAKNKQTINDLRQKLAAAPLPPSPAAKPDA